MRRNRLLALALGAALALTCLSACGGEQESGQRHKVVLVAKSTQTEFWLSVFAGAQAAQIGRASCRERVYVLV